ncbi:MAG TPA: CHAD domain-containing protein [Chthoniobacterales bacterium]
MNLRLKRNEDLQQGLHRITEQRVGHLLESLGQEKLTPEAIHEVRKNVKNLRAILRLSQGAIAEPIRRRRNRALHDFAATLSGPRDAAVILDVFLKACRASLTFAEEPTWLREGREPLEKEAQGAPAPDELKAVTKRVKRLAGNFLPLRQRPAPESRDVADVDGWKGTVEAGLQKTYKQGRRLLQAISEAVNPAEETWHEFRKRAKDLGYQLALLEKLKRVDKLVAELDKIGSALGDARDLTMLQGYLRERLSKREWMPEEQREYEQLCAHIEAQRAQLQRRAVRLAQRVYQDGSRRFASRMEKRWIRWRENAGKQGPRSAVAPGKKGDGVTG